MTKIDQVNKLRSELNEVISSITTEDFVQHCKENLFNKFPCLESVKWRQYTPYFNDGDICYFGVHCYADNDDILLKEDVDAQDGVYTEAEKFINFLDEEVLKHLFDDGKEVIIYHDGTITETYYEND